MPLATVRPPSQRCSVIVFADSKPKGFGRVGKNPGSDKNPSDIVKIDGSNKDKALKQALSAAGANRKAAPVNPEEAAKGRVVFAEVDEWGSGDRDKLGELKVKRYNEAYRGDDNLPFHQQLVQHLELAQSRGAMAIVSSGAPLPAFKLWSFKLPRYLQYLSDMLAVHVAVEEALAKVTAGHISATSSDGRTPSSSPTISALALLSPTLGLTRSAEITHDLLILTSPPTPSPPTPDAPPPRTSPPGPTPTPTARSLAQTIAKHARDATLSGALVADKEAAAARLLAYAYAVHVSHLSAGMRCGAAAAEKLGLGPLGALAAWSDWPNVQGDPKKLLHDTMDEAGTVLTRASREAVLDELPRAVGRTAQLMSALAHEN